MDETTLARNSVRAVPPLVGAPVRFLLNRFVAHFSDVAAPFDLVLPDGSLVHLGSGAATFRVHAKTNRGFRALASLDEGRVAESYIYGDIDIDGDMLRPFELRGSMGDRHLLTTAWRFVQPLLFGQVHTNKQAISAHYDIDPRFFLSFLDPKIPCYTQGIYESADETLDTAMLRKFDYCFRRLHLKPGDHIFEIGPGWGAWFEYAAARGVRCTGITNSVVSRDYLTARGRSLSFDWEILLGDFLEYESRHKYDAIVIMGVIEHLPQYQRVLDKFRAILKPGGYIFLDGSANNKKYELSSFMVKYIYGGNHSFLALHDLLDKMSYTRLRVTELFNDRYSYFLTFHQWAKNLEANRDMVIAEFGDFNYRRFRLYLWGATYEFLSRSLDCYRMIIELPPI
jgi:cyclopropane-fatty-acyl-phospholipid synthase